MNLNRTSWFAMLLAVLGFSMATATETETDKTPSPETQRVNGTADIIPPPPDIKP